MVRIIHSADALVGDFRKHPGSRIVFFCGGCGAPRAYDAERIIDRLRALRLGGYNTPVRELGRHARMACRGCGGARWDTQLAYPDTLDKREAERIARAIRS